MHFYVCKPLMTRAVQTPAIDDVVTIVFDDFSLQNPYTTSPDISR